MNDLFLVIDQGGQSTRVAVFDRTGKMICLDSSLCATQIINIENHQQHIEQNPHEILDGMTSSFNKIVEQLGVDVKRIKSAGFSGQGSSLLCWNNKTGEALTPVLSWQDTRAKDYLQQLNISQEEIQKITGLRISPHYGASKIRWCLDQSSEVQDARGKNQLSIGPIVSFILWHLAGYKNQVDPGHAQRTLLWNMQTANWDKTLLDLFAIPQTLLPQCLFHQDNFGKLKLANHSIDFRVCARDQGASLFALGMPDKQAAYINIGTGAFIQRIHQDKKPPEGVLVSPLWISEDHQSDLFAWEATVNGAAAAIPYIEQVTGLKITPELIDQALLQPLGTDDFFINTQGGLGAPFWRTDIESRFSNELSPIQQVAAWLESIMFLLLVNLQKMNADNWLTQIQLSGGFSRSDKFCQRLANLCQLPLVVTENPEASLQGIAYLTSGCSSTWEPSSEKKIIKPQVQDLLHKRFQYWLNKLQSVLS